jgi:hypothetical protein
VNGFQKRFPETREKHPPITQSRKDRRDIGETATDCKVFVRRGKGSGPLRVNYDRDQAPL